MTASLFFVRGSDPVLRDRALDDLVDELLGDDDRTLALDEFVVPARPSRGDDDAGGDSSADERDSVVAAALGAASSPPFMTTSRVIVLRDASALLAGHVEQLARYAEAPLETTRLVLVAGGARSVPVALTRMLKAAGAVERAPTSEKTGDVLLEHARDAGVLLTGDAARSITEHLAGDAGRVVALVDVLATAGEPGATLGVDDVAPYLGEEGAVPPFALTNAVESGDVPGALEVLHRLMTVTTAQQPRPMHPLQIMGTLLGYYRRALRLDDPTVRSTADAVAALGGKVKEFPARKALAAAGALGTDGLREAFDALSRADLDLKGARGIPPDVVMEVLVVRLARLSARAGLGGKRGGGRPAARRR